MPEMIGAELELEPIRCRTARRPHHAGVVDQHIEPLVLRADPPRRLVHRFQRGEVEHNHAHLRVRRLCLDLLAHHVRSGFIPTGQYYVRTRPARTTATRRPTPAVAPVMTIVRGAFPPHHGRSGEAFFSYFHRLFIEGTTNKALFDTLAASGPDSDLKNAVTSAGRALTTALGDLWSAPNKRGLPVQTSPPPTSPPSS